MHRSFSWVSEEVVVYNYFDLGVACSPTKDGKMIGQATLSSNLFDSSWSSKSCSSDIRCLFTAGGPLPVLICSNM